MTRIMQPGDACLVLFNGEYRRGVVVNVEASGPWPVDVQIDGEQDLLPYNYDHNECTWLEGEL